MTRADWSNFSWQDCANHNDHLRGRHCTRRPRPAVLNARRNPFHPTSENPGIAVIPGFVAPPTGFEPVTVRLTAGCSAVELRGIARSILTAIGSAQDPQPRHVSRPAEARTRSSRALARWSISAGGVDVPETVTWEKSDPSGFLRIAPRSTP